LLIFSFLILGCSLTLLDETLKYGAPVDFIIYKW
jgi:hypothetical protein